MGELVSYRGSDPVRRHSARSTGMWLSTHARQQLFEEHLLREVAKLRLQTLRELEMDYTDFDIEMGTRILKEMEAHQDNLFLLASLEQRFVKWKLRADHILDQAAVRRLL